MKKTEIAVILHNIRSSENAGSIMRTADAAGVARVYFAGYTPSPFDRFKRTNQKFVKASLGAEEFVAWETRADIAELIEELRAKHYQIVSVELSPDSIPFTRFTPSAKVAYIFGNEVDGVPEEILKVSDAVIEIPMKGKKESLNVAVVAGIVLFGVQP